MDENGDEVTADKSVAHSVLTITPSNSLEFEETYTLIIEPGDIIGADGSALESEFVLDFTTDKFHENPVVSFTYSANGMSDALTTDNINIVFNEEILLGNNLNSIKLTGNGQNIAINSQINDSTLILNPSGTLRYDTKYTVTISQGAVLNNAGKDHGARLQL